MENRYKFLLEVVQEAGQMILDLRNKGFEVSIKDSDYRNVLTEVDLKVNDFLKSKINHKFPGENIYSEETDGILEKKGSLWTIDPIDGTSNFARDIPHFAVVLSYLFDGEVYCASIYNPVTKEIFSFQKGGGVFLDDKKVSVSTISDLKNAYIFLHIGRKEENHNWGLALQSEFLKKAKKTTNLGSSALDLCFLAAGRVDAVIYGTLTTADIPGAIFMVREAGGEVYNEKGEPVTLSIIPQKIIATSTPKLFKEINQI